MSTAKSAMRGFPWIPGSQRWVLLFQNSCRPLLNGLFIKTTLHYLKHTKPAAAVGGRLVHPSLTHVIPPLQNSRALTQTKQDVNAAGEGRAALAPTANKTLLEELLCL